MTTNEELFPDLYQVKRNGIEILLKILLDLC